MVRSLTVCSARCFCTNSHWLPMEPSDWRQASLKAKIPAPEEMSPVRSRVKKAFFILFTTGTKVWAMVLFSWRDSSSKGFWRDSANSTKSTSLNSGALIGKGNNSVWVLMVRLVMLPERTLPLADLTIAFPPRPNGSRHRCQSRHQSGDSHHLDWWVSDLCQHGKANSLELSSKSADGCE